MRLIDADQMLRDESEAYMNAQRKVSGVTYAVNACVHEKLLQLIADTPTADPVRHGKWKKYSTTMMECQLCGKHVARHRFSYCPGCGAKMEGWDEDE